MKKFKTNESGFLDGSYNFEGIKKQFQDEISRNKSRLKDFREGTDYTVSYENDGQKKLYNIHSLQLKKVYWGDNIPDGFEYSIEEDSEGVRTKMKMIGAVGENFPYQQNYIADMDTSQKGIEGNNALTSNDELVDKISSLREELRRKEQDIQNLENYPKKQDSFRIEAKNIKDSIKALTEQSLKKGSSKSEKNKISTGQVKKKDNSLRDGGGGGYTKPLLFGGLFFLGLIGIVFAKIAR